MPIRNVRFRLLILYIVLGALFGSLFGKIAELLPPNVIREFFTRSVTPGFEPVTIDLNIITLTFGFTFELNIAGVIGIALAVYMLRWYR